MPDREWEQGAGRGAAARWTGAPRRPARAGRRGITILHVLGILLLLTALATLAIPAWYGRAEVTLENAANLLTRDLRSAQNGAVLLQSEVRVVFLADGSGYYAVDATGLPLRNPTGGGDFVRVYDRDAVFQGVRVEHVELGPDRTAVFDTRGFSLLAGWVELSFEGERRRVVIARGSGVLAPGAGEEPWARDGE